jgi:hypothetical protein
VRDDAEKPLKWKEDTRASVDQFNERFMKFAPQAFRETCAKNHRRKPRLPRRRLQA